MKQILTLLFLINLIVSCAQNEQTNVSGEWKITSINSGDFYINTKTDSVSISKQFKEIFSDSLELDNVIKVAKMTYTDNIMVFDENGVFTKKIDSEIRMSGTYKIDRSHKKIIVLLKDKVNWEMDYKIVDSLLHLTTTLYGKKSEFILERIGK